MKGYIEEGNGTARYYLELEKENKQLKEENHRLKKEVELEGRVRDHWKTIAELFHDTLWQTLMKYEPETYGKLYPHKEQKEDVIGTVSCQKCPIKMSLTK